MVKRKTKKMVAEPIDWKFLSILFALMLIGLSLLKIASRFLNLSKPRQKKPRQKGGAF